MLTKCHSVSIPVDIILKFCVHPDQTYFTFRQDIPSFGEILLILPVQHNDSQASKLLWLVLVKLLISLRTSSMANADVLFIVESVFMVDDGLNESLLENQDILYKKGSAVTKQKAYYY